MDRRVERVCQAVGQNDGQRADELRSQMTSFFEEVDGVSCSSGLVHHRERIYDQTRPRRV